MWGLRAILFLLLTSSAFSYSREVDAKFWSTRLAKVYNWHRAERLKNPQLEGLDVFLLGYFQRRIQSTEELKEYADLSRYKSEYFPRESSEIEITQTAMLRNAANRIEENLDVLRREYDLSTQWLLAVDTLLCAAFVEHQLGVPAPELNLGLWNKLISVEGTSFQRGDMLLGTLNFRSLQNLVEQTRAFSQGTDSLSQVKKLVWAVFTREFIECLVVLFALVAGLVLEDKRQLLRGAGVGLLSSFGLFGLLLSLTTYAALNGWLRYYVLVNSVLSLSLLLFATHWNFHKVYWSKWISTLKKMSQSSRERILFAAGFFAVFREGSELSLSMSVFRLESGLRPIGDAFLYSLPLVIVFAALLFSGKMKTKLRPLLIISGGAMILVTVIFAGFTVRLLQAFDWIPSSPLPFTIPTWAQFWFSIHPTVEGLGLMLICSLAIFSPLLRSRFRSVKLSLPARKEAFSIVEVLIALGIVSMVLFALSNVFQIIAKGTIKTRMHATLSSLEFSILDAVKDPEVYAGAAIDLASDTGAAGSRFNKLNLTSRDINGNIVTVASSASPLYFRDDGTPCGPAADFPNGCPIRVVLDVLRTNILGPTPQFSMAYQISTDSKVLATRPRGSAPEVGFPSPAPDPALAASYSLPIPIAYYVNNVASPGSDCGPWGMRGLNSAQKPICLSKPAACPLHSVLTGVKITDPAFPANLKPVCKLVPTVACPAGYALRKLDINSPSAVGSAVAGACRFVTTDETSPRAIEDKPAFKMLGCPRKYYEIVDARVSCIVSNNGGEPRVKAVKAIQKRDPADVLITVATCVLICEGGCKVPADAETKMVIPVPPSAQACRLPPAFPTIVSGEVVE